MDLCGPMRVANINGKRYVLVIVDDYSRYTWTHVFRSKDETLEVLIDFLRLVQRGLQAQVRVVQTDKGTKFLNQTLHAYFAAEGINHQNGIVKRRNRTLVEAARTMLSVAKVPLFFWVEAIATACFTQNRSLVIPHHEKTPYHIINDRKPSVKFFHIFGSICYIVRDGENLDKMKEKDDECIFVGYSTQSRAYRVFNKRKRVIMEYIHVNFNELPQMASDQLSSDLVPECHTMALNHDSLCPVIQRQANVSQEDRTVLTSKELDLLFSSMFDELLNGSSKVVSKSSAVSAADAPNQRQHHTTPLNNHTTPAPTCQVPTLAPTVISSEKINQAETYAENDQVADDEFINIFSTPVQDQGETDGENLDKMKEKGDECIFVGYSTQSRAYRVFNKRTRVIMESIHVNFDELPHKALVQNSTDPAPTRHSMASTHNSSDPAPTCQKKASVQISSDPAPECQTMALEHGRLSPGRNFQENVSHGNKTGTTSNELDLLFSPMFNELLNGSSKVVSKSSAVSAADAPNQRQQPTTPLNNHTTPVPTCQNPPISTSVISSENINQAEPHAENDQVSGLSREDFKLKLEWFELIKARNF
nr:Gag-Pol polyprotein [Tanacetum cinerariifolium]